MKSIYTKRLEIRPFIKDDTQKVFELSQEPTLAQWIPDQVYDSLEETEKVLDFLIKKSYHASFPLVMAIVLRDTQEVIGHVGLSEIDQGIEIGYGIGMAYQKKGYGKEAVKAYTYVMMERMAIEKVYGIVHSENIGSCKLLESIGYRQVPCDRTSDMSTLKERRVYRYLKKQSINQIIL